MMCKLPKKHQIIHINNFEEEKLVLLFFCGEGAERRKNESELYIFPFEYNYAQPCSHRLYYVDLQLIINLFPCMGWPLKLMVVFCIKSPK